MRLKAFGKRALFFSIVMAMQLMTLSGCAFSSNGEGPSMNLFGNKKIVGKDITSEDIKDFYYTKENINFDAFYQRYRFFVEGEKYMFFHETRDRKGRYGPCTEEDTTKSGTIELSEEQWKAFFETISNGTVTAREDSADSGSSGPWTFLYWKGDKSKYQQFSFESYDKENAFLELCLSLE